MSELQTCLSWTRWLIALAVLLQSVELLQVRRAYADSGVWSWQILAAEHGLLPAPVRWLCAALLPYDRFVWLVALRVPLCGVLVSAGWPWAAPLLLLGQLLICVRFRGTFNGGSDYMTVVVLLALSVAALAPFGVVTQASLAYICAQLVFSYFVAGLAKLVQRDWRNGAALSRLLGSSRYGTPAWLRRWAKRPRLTALLSWGVLAFEAGFPLALLGPRLAWSACVVGAAFHVGNTLAFGLNRFLFCWLAAYPALLFFAERAAHALK